MIANACRWVPEGIGHAAHWSCSAWNSGEVASVLGMVLGIFAVFGLLLGFLLHHHYAPHHGGIDP